MTGEIIHIYDFGSQYTQLIARRIRELNVYCEIYPYQKLPELTRAVKGIILSGSPYSVLSDVAVINTTSYRKILPVLGICYGAQLIAHQAGAKLAASKIREYGSANLNITNYKTLLTQKISPKTQVWMSHSDTIIELPGNFKAIAHTDNIPVGAFHIDGEDTYGLQFHPEVTHSAEGKKILKNFVVNICQCKQNWTPDAFVQDTVEYLQKKLGDDKVIMALSGGVDSSVAALLLHRVIGKNLYCIFIDNGLLRKNEFHQVLSSYEGMGLNIKGVDRKQYFYQALKNISSPEEKRKAIGKAFIEIFEEEAKKIKTIRWLGQGTIYPDIIESLSVKGPSATIKSHHNVGGLPHVMQLKVVEPLNNLFKDEVRCIGKKLGVDTKILGRHPFPGPGLGIRILGTVDATKVRILQEVDAIFIDAMKEAKLYDQAWQAGAILLPVHSVGVMGDERTYENVVSLRAVMSADGMTADWCRLPYNFLKTVSNKIINQVKGVNRVVYDISSKPPATIEWE